MNFKQNTVLIKLIASYTFMVLFALIVAGIPSYIILRKNFNAETEKRNIELLSYFRKTIENEVFSKSELIYASIVNTNSVLESFAKDEHIGFDTSRDILSDMTVLANRNSDIMESINLYYAEENILISTTGGVNNFNSGKIVTSPLASFIDEAKERTEKSFWSTADNSNSESVLRYCKAFPNNCPLNLSTCIIILDIKSSSVTNLLKNYASDDGCMFILDENGEIIAGTDGKFLSDNSHIDFDELGNNTIFTSKSGEKSILNYQMIGKANWKFVSIASANNFYKATAFMGNLFLILAVLTIIIGIILARLFANQAYAPIRNITTNISKYFGKGILKRSNNEISAINDAIDEISTKMIDMEAAISYNEPLILYNIVNGLFRNTISDISALEEQFKLLNIPLNAKWYRTIIFKLDSELIENLSIENSEYMIYNIIMETQSKSMGNDMYISAKLSDCEIGVAVFNSQNDDNKTKEYISGILEYVFCNFNTTPLVFSGNWISKATDLYISYQQATELYKYVYFFPSQIVFTKSEFETANSPLEDFPESLVTSFENCLKENDVNGIELIFNEFQNLINTKKYSAQKCDAQLASFISILSSHLRGLNITTETLQDFHQMLEFSKIKNITQCREWIYNIVDNLYIYLKSKKDGIQVSAVERAREYINEHLAEDISVDFLADMVAFSPSYLSRMFKSFTGSTIVEYITLQRMERAREYIITDHSLTIEQIGKIVGFNSPAYFVKKFRETYGTSPKNYRQIHIKL